MRPWIRRIGVLLVSVIIVVLIGGMFLPTKFGLSRAIDIQAKPEAIHEYVGDLKKWDVWAPWKEEDPEIVTTLGAITSGVGANQSWTDREGGGSLTLTMSSPDRGIEYDLFFDQGKYQCKSAMRYEVLAENVTKVTWSMQGDMNMPIIGGYLALMMDSMIGTMFERGLLKLKVHVEQG